MNLDLLNGDCLELLSTYAENSIDSIVTDPPYGIGFMGNHWDRDVPGADVWRECLRVLKPGGHLLAFAGTRTQHRMCTNIENSGFEIRDMIAWVYGSGFPKSRGTLKPALEPITLARKPLCGTVAQNVQAHGTGAINIDACRIDNERWPANFIHDGCEEVLAQFPITQSGKGNVKRESGADRAGNTSSAYGRENRAEGTEMISYGDKGSAARFFYCAKASKRERDVGLDSFPIVKTDVTSGAPIYGCRKNKDGRPKEIPERRNFHPTVKPLALMRYLCMLITPPGGIVLDPFMGSGSTGVAAISEGFRFIGIELDPDFYQLALHRINHALPA